MAKRPSLAESMKAIEKAPPAPVVSATAPELPLVRKGDRKAYHAATREGKTRVTAPISPADHVRLKRLALDQGMARGQRTTIEHLLAEAISDLFRKYGA